MTLIKVNVHMTLTPVSVNPEHCYASNTTHRATNTGQVIQTYSLEQKIQLWLIGEEIGQRTKDKGQRTKDKGQRTKDKGQKIYSLYSGSG
nr:MAG TPA: hypothetical protein [Caudoviricetes sp.]